MLSPRKMPVRPMATPRFQKMMAVISAAGERTGVAAHARQQPDGEAEAGGAGPAVDERIDGGGPDAAVGEHAEVVGEIDEEAEDREASPADGSATRRRRAGRCRRPSSARR